MSLGNIYHLQVSCIAMIANILILMNPFDVKRSPKVAREDPFTALGQYRVLAERKTGGLPSGSPSSPRFSPTTA
jgi:hypothetical protein